MVTVLHRFMKSGACPGFCIINLRGGKLFMAEQTNVDLSKSKPMTDKELEELLRKSDQKAEYPEVKFDEFTVPTTEEWVEACNALLKGKPFDKMMYTKNYEGITFDPIYTLRKWKDILPTDNYPGRGDFLRGSTVNGYVEQPWGIAQACDLTEPKENNTLLKHEIKTGSTVYHVRVDSATLAGVDVKDAAVPGDKGVSLTTAEDMHTMLADLDLEKYPFMLYAGESSARLLALTVAALKAAGKKVEKLRGVIGADPIGELVAKGKTAESLDVLYDQMAATVKWAEKNAPGLRTIMVRSNAFSLGGAESVQEVAYTYAVAVEYVRQMLKRGLTIHQIAQALIFEFNQGANFFMEIAKLRAARQIWANIMKEFGAEEADRASFVHGRPATFTKTVVDPYVNMLRNCTQSFSSVVGGVNTYENEPFDELIRKGDEFSRRIARNVHIMLQEEFGMLWPIDPAGGSWAVERLTQQITEKIWAKFQEVEGFGGIIPALQEGKIQAAVKEVLDKRLKALELRKDRAVGVNMYPNMTEEPLSEKPEDVAELKKILSANVDKYLADVDSKEAEAKLAAVKSVGSEGLIDAAVEAFAAGATSGAVARAAAKKAGEIEVQPIEAHHWTERFEALRRDTEAFVAKTGKNVEVFLANMGPIPQHKARADFSTSFLQVGAFNVHLNDGFQDDEDKPGSRYEKCVAALKEGIDGKGTPYDAAVICSTDATYPEDVPALAPMLKAANPTMKLYLAGAAPKDLVPVYTGAGVDDFISVVANCFDILKDLQKRKGMIE